MSTDCCQRVSGEGVLSVLVGLSHPMRIAAGTPTASSWSTWFLMHMILDSLCSSRLRAAATLRHRFGAPPLQRRCHARSGAPVARSIVRGANGYEDGGEPSHGRPGILGCTRRYTPAHRVYVAGRSGQARRLLSQRPPLD